MRGPAAVLMMALAFAADAAKAAPPAAKPGAAASAAGGQAVAFTTVVQRSIPGQTGGELRAVARDADTWSSLWASLREKGGDALPATPPAVNFPREMALLVAMPTQSCTSQVTVQSIQHLGDRYRGTLLVTLLEAPPASNCRCMVSSRPVHIVRLPRTGGTLRFVVHHGQTPCGPPPH